MLRALAVLLVLLPATAATATAQAQVERALTSLEEVQAACRDAVERPAADLLVVEVAAGWRFGTVGEDGFVEIDPGRAFRALGGRVELFPSRLETIGLVAGARFDVLEAARARGARLRLGFFLGMDEPDRTACVLRSRHGVTTVRMDVAYVELVDAEGATIARDDGDRLRAFREEHERDAVPGSGPRASIEPATAGATPAPEAWQRAYAAAARGEVGRALAACHSAGIARGAEPRGRVLVRVRVDGRTGRATDSAVALSDLGDAEEARCLSAALRSVVLSPGPGEWARPIDLTVPLRLAAD